MRVTGGTARGVRLAVPGRGSRRIRPTSDRTREALFSIIGPQVADSTVLDLYAGTGTLGIEALSRGAARAVFVDRSRQALELIHANLERCFSSPRAMLVQCNLAAGADARQLVARIPDNILFDLVFLDPPYEKKLAESSLKMVDKTGLVRRGGTVVAEERKNVELPEQFSTLVLTDRRRYGETALWFYRRPDNAGTMARTDNLQHTELT